MILPTFSEAFKGRSGSKCSRHTTNGLLYNYVFNIKSHMIWCQVWLYHNMIVWSIHKCYNFEIFREKRILYWIIEFEYITIMNLNIIKWEHYCWKLNHKEDISNNIINHMIFLHMIIIQKSIRTRGKVFIFRFIHFLSRNIDVCGQPFTHDLTP